MSSHRYLVLMHVPVNTAADTIYVPSSTYYTTAGIGTFNGSLVQPFLAASNGSIPYGLHSWLSSFVSDPEVVIAGPPVDCFDVDHCISYLIPGSLGNSAPWPPKGSPEDPVVEIWDAPAIQYEFLDSIDGEDELIKSDCDVIGSEKYILAVEVCIGQSTKYPGSLIARKLAILCPRVHS